MHQNFRIGMTLFQEILHHIPIFGLTEVTSICRLPEQFRQVACAFLFISCRYPTLAMKPLIFCAASFFIPAVTWVYTSSENSAEA